MADMFLMAKSEMLKKKHGYSRLEITKFLSATNTNKQPFIQYVRNSRKVL